jgi:glycosyltransferase involved in cell wall biosynthesis
VRAVSVVIPTYNRVGLVTLAVKSVLAQTFRDFEVIVVDDGSKDGTQGAVTSLGSKVRYIYQRNQGTAVARNVGIAAARGEFISFLDSDDTFRPHNLELLFGQLERNPNAHVLHGWAETVDELGRRTQWTRPKLKGTVFRQYLYSNPTPIGTVLAHRDCFSPDNLFDPSLPMFEDWDLWLRLSFQYEFDFVPAVVADIRFQGARRNTGHPAAQVAETVSAIYAKLLDDPPSAPPIGHLRRRLASNVHVLSGHHCRVFEGDLRAARRQFLTAVQLAPGFLPAYFGLVETLAGSRPTHRLRVIRAKLWSLRR